MTTLCPYCNKEINSSDIFCPFCGKKQPAPNSPFSFGQKLKIYSISFFLAPFGLIWFFKYFRNSNPDKRRTAYTALVITLIVTITVGTVSYYYYKAMMDYLNNASSLYQYGL